MIRTKSPEEAGLALALIQIDGGTQSRANVNDQVVNEYAEAIQAGATFPPIVVFYDGKKHWLADGFHRFHAYRKIGREKVAADVRQGTRRDAILHSVGANETHGLRRTNDDKRRAVLTLLGDAEWSAKPERWIAATAHVSHTFVQKVRAAHLATLPDRPAEKQVERGGATYPMKTAGINASRATNFRAENVQVDAADHQKENAVEFVAAQGFDPADRPVAASAEFAQPRNIFDELVSLWKEADAGVRQDFKAYITGSEFVAKFNLTEGNPAPDTGGSDVDRSAERASSAVEVGATNSPDGAQASLANGPCEAVSERTANLVGPATGSAEAGVSGQPEVIPALTGQFPGTNVSGPERAGVTAGETALTSQSTAPAVEAVAGNPQAPRDPATAEVSNPQEPNSSPVIADSPVLTFSPASGTTFENPRCLQPYTCHLSHSRDACHDCLMAWSRRPKTEQIRLWAEANEAARAA